MRIIRWCLWGSVWWVALITPILAGSIEGRFLSANQVPQDGVEIVLIDVNTWQIQDRIDTLSRDGGFVFWQVPNGRYAVVARQYLSPNNPLDFVEAIRDNVVVSPRLSHVGVGKLKAAYPTGVSKLSLIADEDRQILDAVHDIQFVQPRREIINDTEYDGSFRRQDTEDVGEPTKRTPPTSKKHLDPGS